MYKLAIHKDAEKNLQKAPLKIKDKFLDLVQDLLNGNKSKFIIVNMKGKYKIYQEAKIDKDYRIIFRIEEDVILIRYAGTHNALGTG